MGKSGDVFVCEIVLVFTSQTSFSKKLEKTVALQVEEVRTLIVTQAPVRVDDERNAGFQVILVPYSIEFEELFLSLIHI